MRGTKRTGTEPEQDLRRALHRGGPRFAADPVPTGDEPPRTGGRRAPRRASRSSSTAASGTRARATDTCPARTAAGGGEVPRHRVARPGHRRTTGSRRRRGTDPPVGAGTNPPSVVPVIRWRSARTVTVRSARRGGGGRAGRASTTISAIPSRWTVPSGVPGSRCGRRSWWSPVPRSGAGRHRGVPPAGRPGCVARPWAPVSCDVSTSARAPGSRPAPHGAGGPGRRGFFPGRVHTGGDRRPVVSGRHRREEAVVCTRFGGRRAFRGPCSPQGRGVLAGRCRRAGPPTRGDVTPVPTSRCRSRGSGVTSL